MYHLINDLYPGDKKPENLQLYYYDSDDELVNRMACSDKVNDSVVWELMDMLRINPYSFFIWSLIDILQLHNSCITFSQVTIYFMGIVLLLLNSEHCIFPEENEIFLEHEQHYLYIKNYVELSSVRVMMLLGCADLDVLLGHVYLSFFLFSFGPSN